MRVPGNLGVCSLYIHLAGDMPVCDNTNSLLLVPVDGFPRGMEAAISAEFYISSAAAFALPALCSLVFRCLFVLRQFPLSPVHHSFAEILKKIYGNYDIAS
jgi:hypothetical protein